MFCTAYYLIEQEKASNPVDCLFLTVVSGIEGFNPSKKWVEALQGAILIFSDLQMVTGIAVLASGYSQLPCGLASYHWQITVDLAWFSSTTHLTTLTCLRRHLQERPAVRVGRIICMGMMAVMLGVALGSTGYVLESSLDAAFPAWCLFHPSLIPKSVEYSDGLGAYTTYNAVYVAVAAAFLTVSYLTRMIQLFPTILNGVCIFQGFLHRSHQSEQWEMF